MPLCLLARLLTRRYVKNCLVLLWVKKRYVFSLGSYGSIEDHM